MDIKPGLRQFPDGFLYSGLEFLDKFVIDGDGPVFETLSLSTPDALE